MTQMNELNEYSKQIFRSMLMIDEFPGHLLLQSVLWSNHELLNDLLKSEDNIQHVNCRDRNGKTVLCSAVESQSIECVKLLLENGANPNIGYNQKFPLQIAAENGNLPIVELLLSFNADIFAKDTNGLTAMDLAQTNCMTVLKNAADRIESQRNKLFEEMSRSLNSKVEMTRLLKQTDDESIVNATPNGQPTLLYRASQEGLYGIIQLLLEYGADGRAQQLTGYSPLYIASLYGRREICELLLKKFPHLVQQLTIMEQWTPLHAATINNHLPVIRLLLEFPYPPEMMRTFKTTKGDEFQMALDVNACDSRGQTVLYCACRVANEKLVDYYCKFRTAAAETSPFDLDAACNGETPLHAAVRQRNYTISSVLLQNGANPNSCDSLKVAVENRDATIVDLLIRFGARDDSCLKIAAKNGDSNLVSKLLALKSFCDSHAKINKKSFSTFKTCSTESSVCFSSLFPTVPVTINWHALDLEHVQQQWVCDAIVKHNIRLKLSNQTTAINGLTRLDLSGNKLREIPDFLCQMPSLKVLNLAENRIEIFPQQKWNLPVLEELYLNANRVSDIPDSLYDLPEIQLIDLSQNLIVKVSARIFTPKKLKELNLSLNMLSNLPLPEHQQQQTIESHTADAPDDADTELDNLVPHQLKRIDSFIIEMSDSIPQQQSSSSSLITLNLSHNRFSTIPESLSCHIPNLQRLNLSYNSIKSIGSVKSLPSNLKHLDLSQNQICEWFNDDDARDSSSLCHHKQHQRLDNLRTLILSQNLLKTIQFNDTNEWEFPESNRKKLFPNLSMFDLSHNQIKEIPKSISELSNLSVFNLNGNCDITSLPPEMGLLSKLWNLGTSGLSLTDPIRSMIESKRYKTIDIIAFLKSILENSKQYSRMKMMIVGAEGIGKTSLLECIRSEGTSKRRAEHWAKRIGNKNIQMKTPKGVVLSTVGVDINDWTYEKRVRGQTSYGPVTFRTWDFAGQREYYATHQYFLSKRSLYIVMWRIIDGDRGVDGLFQWLVNIQMRAPNSPVIIVGTHYDKIGEFLPRNYNDDLQRQIRERFIHVIDADKCGLPKVLETIEISVKTKHNIKQLCHLIYDSAFQMKCPTTKERILEMKIPAKFLAFEECVLQMASERISNGFDPIMTSDEFERETNELMTQRFGLSFRDSVEHLQASQFLHENGVLLHYEDSTLKDLYFLDPQWLCDMLAHVVTIREINPFVRNGVMKTDDLKQLFQSDSVHSYILNLLNKFELALSWDTINILIPSLLPTEEQMNSGIGGCDVRIPVRSRSWTRVKAVKNRFESIRIVERREKTVLRLLLMQYFPSGFLARLLTRILADDSIIEIIRLYLPVPNDVATSRAEWVCFQSGIHLKYFNAIIMTVKESSEYYSRMKFLVKQNEQWADATKSSILEIRLDNQSFEINSTMIDPEQQCISKLLSIVVDHIDTLLEDWYPSLGTRFVHTSEGKFLITRLVPCLLCLNRDESRRESRDSGTDNDDETIVYSFLVEECIMMRFEQRSPECPLHGSVRSSIPDLHFTDVSDHLIGQVRLGRMLGRGAFGFVFRAAVTRANQSIECAMKMLEPIEPKLGAQQSDIVAYRAAINKWQRDPLQSACKAYCTARQEMNILMHLRHPSIVPFVGLCLKPLALVLSLAPMGSLDAILKNYRRSGIQLSDSVIQKIGLSIAKALEYLHQSRIIYRDLKSENVLVWEMPLPCDTTTAVDVKLADYGISRSTLPSGTKGFGGTEGFMAPEIMRYNGEEEYTEKVDCFSFGMFLYELLTLRLPFEHYECIKEHILEGERPSLTKNDTKFPKYFIELMIKCWDLSPKKRPNISQIVSIISAPEFQHLRDAIELNDTVLCAQNLAQNLIVSGIGKSSKLLSITDLQFTQCYTIKTTEKLTVTEILIVDDCVWFGDAKSSIHVMTAKTFEPIAVICLDESTPTAVRCMSRIGSNHVAISSSSGRLWICEIETHKLKEIGNNGTPFLCATTVRDEIWCGISNGMISILTLNGSIISSHSVISHYTDDSEEKFDVFQLLSDSTHVFSYLYPGCFVYQWSIETRQVTNRIDCSKLAPCSESLVSISIDDHLNPLRCHVTALALQRTELYIGTAWGCLIVVESASMRPITVFRPYEDEVKSIVAFESDSIVTIGKGNRNVLNRYLNRDSNEKGIHAILWSTIDWN